MEMKQSLMKTNVENGTGDADLKSLTFSTYNHLGDDWKLLALVLCEGHFF